MLYQTQDATQQDGGAAAYTLQNFKESKNEQSKEREGLQ